jgi:hypothetical protein
MEPRLVAKKCDVQNILSISGKEVPKPSAILHTLAVAMFFHFVHWCYLVQMQVQLFFKRSLCWWIWDACLLSQSCEWTFPYFALCDQRCPVLCPLLKLVAARSRCVSNWSSFPKLVLSIHQVCCDVVREIREVWPPQRNTCPNSTRESSDNTIFTPLARVQIAHRPRHNYLKEGGGQAHKLTWHTHAHLGRVCAHGLLNHFPLPIPVLTGAWGILNHSVQYLTTLCHDPHLENKEIKEIS